MSNLAMNILFISYYNPLGKGGFEKQARGLFQTLIKDGHQLACLCVSTPEESQLFAQQLKESKLFDLGTFILNNREKHYGLKAKILFWLSKNPARYLASQFPNLQENFHKTIEQINKEINFDVIHCLGLKTLYFLPDKIPLPIIADLVDSRTQYKKRAVSYYFRNYPYKIITGVIDFYKTLKLEKNILLNYSQYPIAVVSKEDANLLNQISNVSSIHTVCHPVAIKTCDLNRKKQYSTKNIQKQKLVFYGFMDHVNFDALSYLIKSILPIVRKRYPEIKLEITGYNLPQEVNILSAQQSSIKIIRNVDNISDFLAEATLTCWAFRYGSGLKNKIIESMLMGKPVVTTTIGAEALTEQQKQGLLIADRAEDLAKHIIYLLDNPQERSRLGEINRHIALTEFTWEKKAKDYLNLYKLAQQKHQQNNLLKV